MTTPSLRAPPAPAENEPTALPRASAEALALLAERRSAKPFHLAEPGPDAETLTEILRLAARVPDHGKLAPWRFLVVEGEARTAAGRALAEAARAAGAPSEETLRALERTFADAPTSVVVVSRAAPHPKIPEWEQILSAGAACFALLVAARAFGFGGVWLTGWASYDPSARSALGLDAAERIAGVIHLGTQTAAQPERARPDMSDIVTYFAG